MTKKKKKKLSENPGLDVIANDVKHIKECTDKLVKKIGYIERGMDQIGLNQQNIDTLKNNIKNINDVRIPNIKGNLKTEVDDINKKLQDKVGSKAFYIMIALLAILNGIAIYFKSIFG